MISLVTIVLSLVSLLLPLPLIAAHGPLNQLSSSIAGSSPSPGASLLCPVLDYAVKVYHDPSSNSVSIYFLSLNSTFETVFTDVHLQSPFESNIRMSRINNQSVALFESLPGSIAEPTNMAMTGTGERFPTGGRSLTERNAAYSSAQSMGSVLQLFNATIPNINLFNDSTVRVWFTYCLNSGLIDCNTEIFVWLPSQPNTTNVIPSQAPYLPEVPAPVIPSPRIKLPTSCPALNFTHKIIKESSTTNPSGYAYKIVFINLDSPEIIAELVDVHYKISSLYERFAVKDWINLRMKPITPDLTLPALQRFSWTTGSIIDTSRTGAGGEQSPPNLQYRQEKELMALKNNLPLQMFEIGGISLNLGDQLNFWFTYCLNMQIDCNTEEYSFRIPLSLPKKEQLFQSSPSSSFSAAAVPSPVSSQDFELLNRPLQQNSANDRIIQTSPSPLTNVIRTAPVMIPSIRTLPIATVPNNPNLNNQFNLHRNTAINIANADIAAASISSAIDDSHLPIRNHHHSAHHSDHHLSASAQPQIRAVYEIDPQYGHANYYHYQSHPIRYYVMHDEL